MNYTVDKSGWDKLKKQLLTLNDTELHIGWFNTSYGPDNDSLPHALVASLNEYGHVNGAGAAFPGTITPPRPFMRVGFRDYMKTDKATTNFKALINSVMNGSTALKAYNMLGPAFVKALQTTMDAWDTPPNSRITVQLKGFNDPLNRTHELIDSVSFEVEKS